MSSEPRRVHVVDALPEIVEHLGAEERNLARQDLVAELLVIRRGSWAPALPVPEAPGHLGLLVLDGLLTRDVILEKPLATELVGRGDLLRPADNDGVNAPIPFDIAWHVLQPARVAVLDPAFARALGRWPAAAEVILKAAVNRAHTLAVTLAVSHLRRVDTRLLVIMWYLADRWGRVRPEGVVVPLTLTHETLARLVGAQRPSVTTALRLLADEGRLVRTPERTWLLRGDPPTSLGRTHEATVVSAP
ncbi:MAG: helix-turn-helix domain-containing protein [Solirubrobacteraceae bacterium]|jgi:hypothetical protein